MLNLIEGHEVGGDIITVMPAILRKQEMVGSDLTVLFGDTVTMFYDDAPAAGFKL